MNKEYDFNSNLPATSFINNNANQQYLRSSILNKNHVLDSEQSSALTTSSSSSSTDTSPFIMRKNQQQNSELLTKMLEIAFKEPPKQPQTSSTASEKTNVKDTSKILKEYRDLNTMVPDSL